MRLVMVFLALVLAACGDEGSPASLNGDLRYVRSGGIAGNHDELVVRPDGTATLKSRRGGESSFELGNDELGMLEAAAQEMPSTEALSPKPAPDAIVYTITYDGRTVRTDDPNLRRSGAAELIGQLEQIIDRRR